MNHLFYHLQGPGDTGEAGVVRRKNYMARAIALSSSRKP